MQNFTKKYFGWMIQSNRPQHFLAGFIIGGFFGFISVIIAAFTAEFKDWAWNGSKGYPILGWKTKNGFDWLDLLMTIIGGAVICSISCFGPDFKFFTGIF